MTFTHGDANAVIVVITIVILVALAGLACSEDR